MADSFSGPVRLDRGHGRTLWAQIADILEKDITQGRLKPGEQLPTEAALAVRFDVNRHTIRRAVAFLVEQGRIRVEQGRGAFVTENVLDYHVAKRTRFSENMSRAAREYRGTVLGTAIEKARPAVVDLMGVSPRDDVIMIERINESDGGILNVSRHYFPYARFKGLEERMTQTGSITEALSHFGVTDFTRKKTRVTARVATAREARLLNQAPGKPVLVTKGVNLDQDGRPIEVSISCWAWNRIQIVFET